MQLREPLPTQHEQIPPAIGLQNRTMFLDSLFLPTIMFALLISSDTINYSFCPHICPNVYSSLKGLLLPTNNHQLLKVKGILAIK